MKLTPEGRTFYGYVAAGCAQFFKGESALSNLVSLENGTIYISATETALHCYLFRAMGEFNAKFPNVHFKILNNSTTDSVNAVKEGKVDLAFVSTELQVDKPLKMKSLRQQIAFQPSLTHMLAKHTVHNTAISSQAVVRIQ